MSPHDLFNLILFLGSFMGSVTIFYIRRIANSLDALNSAIQHLENRIVKIETEHNMEKNRKNGVVHDCFS